MLGNNNEMSGTVDFSQNVEEDSPLEILKLKKESAHVFSLPPMSSSEGHTTSDFKDLVFKGTMRMTLKGDLMYVYFILPTNKIFLVSILDQNYEKFVLDVKDSSRYFSIKAINEQGQAAWYGLAFKQRNDAFDFKTTLIDFKDKTKFEETLKNQGEYKPKYDFKLKTTDDKPKEGNFNKFKFG